MLIVACGLISVSCSNEELSIDNTATESELFSNKPGNGNGNGNGNDNGSGDDNEPASTAVTATFATFDDVGITGDGRGDYVDGSSQQVNSNIRYGDGVGGGLFHYELSMWGNKRNPSRQLVINLNNPVDHSAPNGDTPPTLGESNSSTFLRVGNIDKLDTTLEDVLPGFVITRYDGFVVTRANDLDGEDYRIRCGIDLDNNQFGTQVKISYDYDSETWHAEMPAPNDNDKCSVYLVKKPNDVFIGEYHITFQLELKAQ